MSSGAMEHPAEPAQSRDAVESPRGYTIDELAAATGVPSRTIRFYQAKGALPAPVRRGRIAYYDETHAERLRLVAHLQDRGLSLRAIRDLFQRSDGTDVSVSEWLGVGEQLLQSTWTDDRPRVCTDEELAHMLGGAMRPGLLAELGRVGLIRREGNSSGGYFVASPAMLQLAMKLESAGVELDRAHVAHEILRRQLTRAADELVDYFIKHVPEADGPEAVSRSIEALRTVGTDAVRLIFGQEIERALRSAVEHGRIMPPRKKRK